MEVILVILHIVTTYLLHIWISMKAYIPSIGSVAHLQSIDLQSVRGGFESRRCLFLGSMHGNANSFFINWGLWITLSPEQRLACQRTFIVSTEIHYNINNCAFPAKLDSYHTSAVDPVLGTQNQIHKHLKLLSRLDYICTWQNALAAYFPFSIQLDL